jgi:hypothetical protein
MNEANGNQGEKILATDGLLAQPSAERENGPVSVEDATAEISGEVTGATVPAISASFGNGEGNDGEHADANAATYTHGDEQEALTGETDCGNLRDVNIFAGANIASETDTGKKVAALHKVLRTLDADADAAIQEKIARDLHQITGGAAYGHQLFDWYKLQSKSYPGKKATELLWSQMAEVPMCSDADETEEIAAQSLASVKDDNVETPCAQTTEVAVLPAVEPERKANALDRFSLRGMAHEIEMQMVLAVAFLSNLALLGQFTVLFAQPNIGKTLIVLALLIDAIVRGLINPSLLYYINLDDTSEGLAEKLRIADEYGFNMMVEGRQGFTVKLFLISILEMIAKGQAKNAIIILDTIKKFVDVMDKKQVSNFNNLMRQFVLAGGTVIGLAHTNKNLGANGKPVFSGTSDLRDDCDCAYVLREVTAPAGSNEKVIEAENIKGRGNVAKTAAFAYSTESGISYLELLSSVRVVDDTQLGSLKQAQEVASDADLIGLTLTCIAEGITTKMLLRDAIASRANTTNRAALQLLEKYTGTDPIAHRWTFSVRDRGAKVYAALSAPAVAAEDEGGAQ